MQMSGKRRRAHDEESAAQLIEASSISRSGICKGIDSEVERGWIDDCARCARRARERRSYTHPWRSVQQGEQAVSS